MHERWLGSDRASSTIPLVGHRLNGHRICRDFALSKPFLGSSLGVRDLVRQEHHLLP